jgi:hypothetical protein
VSEKLVCKRAVDSDPAFQVKNLTKKNIAEIFVKSFFDQELQFTHVQATGEAFSPQKRTSSTSKN